MNDIYLVSSDGYKDSVELERYATNEQELIAIIAKTLKENFGHIVTGYTMHPDYTIKLNILEYGIPDQQEIITYSYFIVKHIQPNL